MNGELVGHWRIPARGEDEFHYARSWFDSPACRPLSLSMPLRPWTQPYRGPIVRDFFDNLLPDTDTLRMLAVRWPPRRGPRMLEATRERWRLRLRGSEPTEHEARSDPLAAGGAVRL